MSLLSVVDVRARYGSIEALKGVSLTVDEGEVVTLIGSNGAGKTTTLRTICGLAPASTGTITFDGRDITRLQAHEIAGHGIALTPEGRRCFPRMTVRENLDMGAYRRRGPSVLADYDRVFSLFPVLKERERQEVGTMSGGEQQIYETIAEINQSGVTILLVEQNANYALDAASRGYVLETGRVVLTSDSASLRGNPEVQKAYLGT